MKPISDRWIAEVEDAVKQVRPSDRNDDHHQLLRVLRELKRIREALRQHKLEMNKCFGDSLIPLQLPRLYRATLPEGDK